MFRIILEIVRLGLAIVLDRLRSPAKRSGAAVLLRDSFIRLGVTFIKVGQALSVRRDLLPDDYASVLQSLQDRVPPFPTSVAFQEVERSLDRPIVEIFADIEEAAIATGSVAQVHAARLQSGEEVIVKVRRPGIVAEVERDMRALRLAMNIATTIVPRLRHYHPDRIIEEIWLNLRKELDFRQEARNIRRFVAAFADSATIAVPAVVDALVSEAVIVQQRSGGLHLDDPSVRAHGARLAKAFVESYLHQIFVLGAFHADPHPGNLFILSDGRVCFHDFGLIGVLDRATRRRLAAFSIAFLRQDADWLLDAAIDLGVLGGQMDRAAFRRGLNDIIEDYVALPFKQWSLSDAFLRVARLGRADNVFVPHELLVLMRSMALAENTVRVLDPDFELVETLRVRGPEVLRAAAALDDHSTFIDRLELDIASAAAELPTKLNGLIRRLGDDSNRPVLGIEIHGPEGFERHLDRSANRLALSLVTLGLYIAGSLLSQHSIGPSIVGNFPAFAAIAYAIALWFTLRLARAIGRSGRL